ncbi:MAG: hypothetical protein AB9860_00300 [Methanomassiliicoccales archaeon]
MTGTQSVPVDLEPISVLERTEWTLNGIRTRQVLSEMNNIERWSEICFSIREWD